MTKRFPLDPSVLAEFDQMHVQYNDVLDQLVAGRVLARAALPDDKASTLVVLIGELLQLGHAADQVAGLLAIAIDRLAGVRHDGLR